MKNKIKELESKLGRELPMSKEIVEEVNNAILHARLSDKKEVMEKISILQDLCFRRESQLSHKIKGHDYHNGYSCALHDIRNELESLKSSLKLGDVLLGADV